jgi:hypothetical protein
MEMKQKLTEEYSLYVFTLCTEHRPSMILIPSSAHVSLIVTLQQSMCTIYNAKVLQVIGKYYTKELKALHFFFPLSAPSLLEQRK